MANVFVCVVLLLVLPQGTLAVEWTFSFPSITTFDDFNMASTDPTWAGSFENGEVWLTPSSGSNGSFLASKFMYNRKVPFIMDNGTCSSFSTQFTFKIITTTGYGCNHSSGSGMAFFIAPVLGSPENSAGAWLGLTTPDNTTLASRQLLAVEFDTFLSPDVNDSSGSHVGININSMVSISAVDTNQSSDPLYLYNNNSFTAWIDYDASSSLIQVWMTNLVTSNKRPVKPLLSTTYNLSTVFGKNMYVGISASTAAGSEGHVLYAWDFTIINANSSTMSCVFCKWKLWVVHGVGIFSVGACICIVVCVVWCRRAERHTPRNEPEIDCSVPRYSYRELSRATHGFSEERLLGSGAFSRVYKATFLGSDRSTVAVKRLKDDFGQDPSFPAEIKIINSIRHRNLLQLRGWCYERGKSLLVYDYMPNGSLDRHLFGGQIQGAVDLTSDTRLNILLGIAAALEYLHEGLGESVLHRDVKAANVLLNADLEPLLGDFGLARFIAHDKIVTVTASGTPGYVAPEVFFSGKATYRADVYSFGILALEVACGRRILDGHLQRQEMNLLEWIWLLHQSNRLLEAIDPRMEETIVSTDTMHECRWRCVLHVALSCCHPTPDARPSMRFVHEILKESRILPLPLSRPSFPHSNCVPVSNFSVSSSTAFGTSSGSGASMQ